MALSQIDRDALNLARQNGIELLVVDSAKQEAIYRARCPGVIWHPLAKSVVNAEPQQYFVKA